MKVLNFMYNNKIPEDILKKVEKFVDEGDMETFYEQLTLIKENEIENIPKQIESRKAYLDKKFGEGKDNIKKELMNRYKDKTDVEFEKIVEECVRMIENEKVEEVKVDPRKEYLDQ